MIARQAMSSLKTADYMGSDCNHLCSLISDVLWNLWLQAEDLAGRSRPCPHKPKGLTTLSEVHMCIFNDLTSGDQKQKKSEGLIMI